MFKPKLVIDKDVLEKVKVAAQVAGASSVEEFVERVLLAEAERILQQTGKKEVSKAEIDEIANQMKGLGYLE